MYLYVQVLYTTILCTTYTTISLPSSRSVGCSVEAAVGGGGLVPGDGVDTTTDED